LSHLSTKHLLSLVHQTSFIRKTWQRTTNSWFGIGSKNWNPQGYQTNVSLKVWFYGCF